MPYKTPTLLLLLLFSVATFSQKSNSYKLVWSDEFNKDGKPDSTNWRYENGFVRNRELQWYQPENAYCKNGSLIIEARREKRDNPNFKDSSNNWKQNRRYIEYTSSSLKTQGLQQFQFGRFEVRARIDTSKGSWPAIWTLGIKGGWPLNGEVDIMEFYRVKDTATILANTAWGRAANGGPIWNSQRYQLAHFIKKDKNWPKKFHIWRMDWDKDSINIYLDNELLHSTVVTQATNPDGTMPFLQPQYFLLNLAIGANGGDPTNSNFPIKYEVDYVRYYKKL